MAQSGLVSMTKALVAGGRGTLAAYESPPTTERGVIDREILSSNSSPTVEARVQLNSAIASEILAPLAIADSYEAHILVDNDDSRHHGSGSSTLETIANLALDMVSKISEILEASAIASKASALLRALVLSLLAKGRKALKKTVIDFKNRTHKCSNNNRVKTRGAQGFNDSSRGTRTYP